MVDICKYYYKVGKDDPEDIPGVLTDISNYGIDQIDICTVKVLSDDRVDLKKRLKNQYFEKIRNSDDVIEFRGRIVEVRFANEDRYNLTFKVKSPLERLAKLSSHVTAEWLDTPGTITALDATTFTVSESVTEPPAYVASASGVMIVPANDSVFVEDEVDDITDFTVGATQVGIVANINDDDPDTFLETYKEPQAVIYQVIEGTSTNVKASVIAMDYDVLAKVRVHSIYDCDIKLYYYDYIGTQWVQLGDTVHVEDTNLAGNFYAEIKFKGCLEHNLGIDVATAAFKYKVEATYDGAVMAKIRIAIAEFNFYTDPKYTGTFFPITAYTAAKTLTVTGNPVTSRVEAGDTYVIGWKDSIVIAEIFDQYSLKKFIPFTVDIGTFNNSYTARSFWHLDLMSCLKYFMNKQRAHYWFDHPNNTLYIRTETAMTSEGANRALTTADVETFTHDDKESTAVSNIVFTGGTYKRGDGEEVEISYNYPRVWDGEWSGIGAYELIINKAGIKNWTEARDYIKNIYARLNSPNEMSMTLNLFDYEDDIVVSDKVDLEIDGLVLVDEPVIKIDTSYDVGNDLAIKTLQVGWQHTSFTGILKNFWNDIVDSVEDLAQEIIETKVQRSKLLRVDGIIDGLNIAFDQITIKNQGAGDDSVLSSDSAVLELSLNAKLLLEGLETSSDVIIADGADLKLVFGDHDLIIRKTVDLAQVEIVGDIKVAVGHFLSESIYIGDQLLTEEAGTLQLNHTAPNITLKDIDTATNIIAYLNFLDKDDVKRAFVGCMGTPDLFIQSVGVLRYQGTSGHVFYQDVRPHANNVNNLGSDALEWKDLWIDGIAHLDALTLSTGAYVNDIDITMQASPTDNQLLTAQAIKEFINAGVLANTLIAPSDAQHKIELDPVADSIRIYAGDDPGDEYLLIKSGVGAARPSIYPQIHEHGTFGTNNLAGYQSYFKYMYDDDGTLGNYDEHDDLAIIDNMRVWKKSGITQKDSDNIPLLDYNTIPDFLKGPRENAEGKLYYRRKYIRSSNMAAFSWGAIKQLHRKVKDLTETVTLQSEEILALKTRIN